MPRQFSAAVAENKVLTVPTLFGGTRDELRLYVGYAVQEGRPVTWENFYAHLTGFYPGQETAILAEYPMAPGDSAPALLGTVWTDYNPKVAINVCTYLQTTSLLAEKAPLYHFQFADRDAPVLGVGMPATPNPGFQIGAAHSTGLNYLFPNFANNSRTVSPDLAPRSQTLANRMIESLAAFVTTGNPSTPALPFWPPSAADQP